MAATPSPPDPKHIERRLEAVAEMLENTIAELRRAIDGIRVEEDAEQAVDEAAGIPPEDHGGENR